MKEEVYVTFAAGSEDGPAYEAASNSIVFSSKKEAEEYIKKWKKENSDQGYYGVSPMITKNKYSFGEPISPDEF